VVNDITLENGRYALDLAQIVRRIVLAGARDGIACPEHVHLALRVDEAKAAAGNDGHNVVVIVDPRVVGDLRIEEVCISLVSNARRAVGDGFDGDRRRQVQAEHKNIELGDSSTKRVANLQIIQLYGLCDANINLPS
jgi:hypothetical protein